MLNITGINRFYYIRNFTDMRCKYSRILAVIRHQLGREPQKDEVFIVMSKNRRLVRLFSFDRISSSLYEKHFALDYQFMKVVREGDELSKSRKKIAKLEEQLKSAKAEKYGRRRSKSKDDDDNEGNSGVYAGTCL